MLLKNIPRVLLILFKHATIRFSALVAIVTFNKNHVQLLINDTQNSNGYDYGTNVSHVYGVTIKIQTAFSLMLGKLYSVTSRHKFLT